MQTLKSTGCVLDVRAAPGNTFVDVSRYRHTITNNNVVTSRGLGSSLAGLYDGTTAYLNCGNNRSLDVTDAFTISLWFYSTSWTHVQYPTLISKRDSYASINWQLIYNHNIHDTIEFWFGNNAAVKLFETISASPSLNEWHYIAVTKSGNDYTLFLDTANKGTETDATTIPTGDNVRIGVLGGDALSFKFQGTISSVRIYNRALPAYEILDYYYEYASLLGLD